MGQLKYIVALMLFFTAFSLPAITPPETHHVQHSAVKGAELLSEDEFKALVEDLSHKVSLFQAAWDADPKAEFYGGTARDFLYWIKGKFRGATNRQAALKIAEDLRKTPLIDVRDFIAPDSDIDVVSDRPTPLEAKKYGVRRVDSQSSDVFNLNTEAGRNEILQGYAPAEKIRLSKTGFVKNSQFGDGVGEILSGRLTVHFSSPADFAKSAYAQKKLNHPILLALRYLRLCAVNYFQEHGSGYPDLKSLLDMDPKSKKEVQAVIQKALDGKELTPYLEQDRFKKWLNGSIQKAFRTYTNPTAAMEIMKAFQVDQLVKFYELEPINQYLFAKSRNPEKVQAQISKLGVQENHLFEPVSQHFENGKIYHGTRDDQTFRSILLQGVLPSTRSNVIAGDGLYGVAQSDRQFAENWGGSKDRLVAFDVDPKAKIVDVTKGEGAKAWSRFGTQDYDAFADAIGADIIRYPYDRRAYVVKNSAVLSRPEGVYRKVLTLSKALEQASKLREMDDFWNFLAGIQMAGLNEAERKLVDEELKKAPVIEKIPPDQIESMIIAFDVIEESKKNQLRDNFKALERLKRQASIPEKAYDFLASAIPESHSSTENKLLTFVAERHPRSLLNILVRYDGTRGQESNWNRITKDSIDFLIKHKYTTDPDIQKVVSEIAIKNHHSYVSNSALAFLGTYKHVNPEEDKAVLRAMHTPFWRSSGEDHKAAVAALQGLVATDPEIVKWISNRHELSSPDGDKAWKALFNQSPRLMRAESLENVLSKIDSRRDMDSNKFNKVKELAALFPKPPAKIVDWWVHWLKNEAPKKSYLLSSFLSSVDCKNSKYIKAVFRTFNNELSQEHASYAIDAATALTRLAPEAPETLASLKTLFKNPMGIKVTQWADLIRQIDQSSIRDPFILKESIALLEKIRDGDRMEQTHSDCGLFTRLQLKLQLQ
jgi:hypothetical protein